jgi:hypothetical protein
MRDLSNIAHSFAFGFAMGAYVWFAINDILSIGGDLAHRQDRRLHGGDRLFYAVRKLWHYHR